MSVERGTLSGDSRRRTDEADDMSTDWSKWHDAYTTPDSGLPDRLLAVRDRIDRRLDALAPDPVRVVSACAGDGRDLLGVLEGRADADRVSALLVEFDPELAARARRAAEALPAHVEVLQADAARSDVYAHAVPADLVLLCGIFGNISDDDVRVTIRAAPQLCAPGAELGVDPAPPRPRPHPFHPRLVRRRRFRGDRFRRTARSALVGGRPPGRCRASPSRAGPALVHVLSVTSGVTTRPTQASCRVALDTHAAPERPHSPISRPSQRLRYATDCPIRTLDPDLAALRAATLARICRVEGGYARPDLPR